MVCPAVCLMLFCIVSCREQVNYIKTFLWLLNMIHAALLLLSGGKNSARRCKSNRVTMKMVEEEVEVGSVDGGSCTEGMLRTNLGVSRED